MKAPTIRGLLAGAIVLLLSGCNQISQPEFNPPYYWEPLYLVGQDFVDFEVVDGVLYAADRTQGIHYQKPAYTGKWINLGLETDPLSHPTERYGVTSIVVQDDVITAGLNLPADDPSPRLMQWTLGRGGWRTPTFDPGVVRDLVPAGSGEIVGLDRETTFSVSTGSSWRLSGDRFPDLETGRLFQGPDGIYCGGSDSNRQPRLYHSSDRGDTWQSIDLAKLLGVGVGTVHAFVGREQTPILFCTVDTDIYRSDDGGHSYTHILELPRIPGEIHLNPQDPDELLVIGGNVFWSHDGGASWDIFFLPLRFPARRSVMDWERRKLVVAVNDGLKEAVYAFDLNNAALYLY